MSSTFASATTNDMHLARNGSWFLTYVTKRSQKGNRLLLWEGGKWDTLRGLEHLKCCQENTGKELRLRGDPTQIWDFALGNPIFEIPHSKLLKYFTLPLWILRILCSPKSWCHNVACHFDIVIRWVYCTWKQSLLTAMGCEKHLKPFLFDCIRGFLEDRKTQWKQNIWRFCS